MSHNLSNQELIFHTLLYNQPHFQELLKDVIAQYKDLITKEDPSMRKDIDSQFIAMAKSEITKDLAKRHGISTEDILTTLENVNLLEYLV